MASSSHTARFWSSLALLFALVGAAAMVYYHQGLLIPRANAVLASQGLGNGYSFGNDLYPFWLSAREFQRTRLDPYSAEMTRAIQVGLYGRPLDPRRVGDPVDQHGFLYPAFTDLLLWPTTLVAFPTMRAWVVAVLAALTLWSVVLWARALALALVWHLLATWTAVAALLTMSSYPVLEGLYSGQLGLLVAFLLAAAAVALRREKFLLAGVLMAVATIKPQVTVVLIGYLLLWACARWRVRKKFAIGFVVTLTLLVGASLAVMPHWISSWTQALAAYRQYTRPPLVAEILVAPLGPRLGPMAALVLTGTALVTAAVLAWKNRSEAADSLAFWRTIALMLAITTVVILPGQAVYDHVILIPGILLLAGYASGLKDATAVRRVLFGIGALILFWSWIAAVALVVQRPFLSPGVFQSTVVFSLPLRAVASLPFAVVALLFLTPRAMTKEAA